MWINLTEDEAVIIKDALVLLDAPLAAEVIQKIEELSTPGPHDTAFAEAASRDISDPDEIEGWPGGTPFVSSSEAGAYVMAWMWVDNEDAGIEEENTCRTCGEEYEEGGDGYDGECPDCADKTDQKLHPENYVD